MADVGIRIRPKQFSGVNNDLEQDPALWAYDRLRVPDDYVAAIDDTQVSIDGIWLADSNGLVQFGIEGRRKV